MKYVFFILVIAIFLFFKGCAPASVQKVYIPTKCEIEARERPAYNQNLSLAQNLSEILKYAELLEKDLDFCRKE